MTFAVDANCIIAAVSHWHADHHAAIAELERRLDRELWILQRVRLVGRVGLVGW